MAYQSLYRKYRPQTFADVVGQGHVTRTLQNALASNRVAHGYLFTGTRGTAKTTVARLLAKALNCESTGGPTTEPCNRCPACLAITSGGSIDVIEMDAASHRGVADMEEVRKSVGYGPMELRYKVFIIDEAHQLSSDAKDAFLKTLEEPPDNVVFILATTEPQAIPITIRSRCQQFDFKRGSLADIAARLRYVLDCEGVTYDATAVNLVARGAEGSYRDSLSLLEQVLAFSPEHIASSDVEMVLGALDSEMLAQVTNAIASHDAATAFALAGSLLDSGKEARTLLRTLSLHFRDLLLVSVGGPAVAQELTPEEVGLLQQEAAHFNPHQMIRAMELLNEAQGETRWNNQHRLLVELTFLKLMILGADEKAAPGASLPPVFTSAPIVFPAVSTAPPAPFPVPIPKVITETVPPPVAVAPVAPAAAPVVEAAADEEALPTVEAYFADEEAITDDEDDYVPDDADAPPALVLMVDEDIIDKEPEDTGPSLFDFDDEVPFSVAVPSLSTVPAVSAPLPLPVSMESPRTLEAAEGEESAPLSLPEATLATFEPQFTLNDVERCWGEFLRRAGERSKKTEMMMLRAHPTDVVRDTLEITFRERANYDMMIQPKSLDFVRELLKRCLGVGHLVVHFRLGEDVTPAPTRKPTAKKKTERDLLKELDFLEDESGNNGKQAEVFGNSPSPAPSLPAYSRTSVPERTPSVSPLPSPRDTTAAAAGLANGRQDSGRARNGYGNGNGTVSAIAVYNDEAPPPIEPVVSKAESGAAARRAVAEEHPLVQAVRSIFGGEIVDEE